MANYYVTFRIHDKTVNNLTYEERYDRFLKNIRKEGQGFWTETTSFLMVSSDLSTTAFSKGAVQGLSPQYDLVVVFDPEDMSACCFGAVEHFDVLQSFLPLIKKIG